jgi:hypothetical protein
VPQGAASVKSVAIVVIHEHGSRTTPVRFLIRDHDRKFTDRFDAVFESSPLARAGTRHKGPLPLARAVLRAEPS